MKEKINEQYIAELNRLSDIHFEVEQVAKTICRLLEHPIYKFAGTCWCEYISGDKPLIKNKLKSKGLE